MMEIVSFSLEAKSVHQKDFTCLYMPGFVICCSSAAAGKSLSAIEQSGFPLLLILLISFIGVPCSSLSHCSSTVTSLHFLFSVFSAAPTSSSVLGPPNKNSDTEM